MHKHIIEYLPTHLTIKNRYTNPLHQTLTTYEQHSLQPSHRTQRIHQHNSYCGGQPITTPPNIPPHCSAPQRDIDTSLPCGTQLPGTIQNNCTRNIDPTINIQDPPHDDPLYVNPTHTHTHAILPQHRFTATPTIHSPSEYTPAALQRLQQLATLEHNTIPHYTLVNKTTNTTIQENNINWMMLQASPYPHYQENPIYACHIQPTPVTLHTNTTTTSPIQTQQRFHMEHTLRQPDQHTIPIINTPLEHQIHLQHFTASHMNTITTSLQP